MSRYPPTTLSKLPSDVKPWAEELEHFVEELAVRNDDGPIFQYAQADGAMIGPYPVVIASKDIGKVLKGMQDALRQRTEPAADVRTVAILAVVAKFQAKYAKYSFTATGKWAGMSEEQLAALRNGKKPSGLSEAASITWDLVSYLINEKGPLPDDLYNTAVDILGKDGALVAVHYAGFYSHICILENFADAPYPDGVEGL